MQDFCRAKCNLSGLFSSLIKDSLKLWFDFRESVIKLACLDVLCSNAQSS